MLLLQGVANCAAEFITKEQLSDRASWAKFVNQFRLRRDGDNAGWRGEYWGKMMRGGALICEYTKDEALYQVLCETMRDMMSVAESDGRVSSFAREHEFTAWDLWCRKYVLLGSEYFLEICRDEPLRAQIIQFLCRQADYILEHIGEGKTDITLASGAWYGINSSSILEPMVKLYRLTGAQKYLDFSAYIVARGGADGIDIFRLAYENKLLPYQYGVNKAYEMISCFEGLLEYYLVTGESWCKTAVCNFANAVLESEVSILGSCGVTHELFDHTATRQTTPYDGVNQETCVTVTWMKFCAKILALTEDSRFADAMEQAFYNAYLGALNTEHKTCPYVNVKYTVRLGLPPAKETFLPFDSYSPLTAGKRGQKTGGLQILEDNTYYGCCACIGAAGVGAFLQNAVTLRENILTVNFYERGEAAFDGIRLKMDTDYPTDGNITIRVLTDRDLTLRLRHPQWTGNGGYQTHTLSAGEHTLNLSFAMPLRRIFPTEWERDTVYTDSTTVGRWSWVSAPVEVTCTPEELQYVAFARGPLVLGADDRLGKAANGLYDPDATGEIATDWPANAPDCLLKMKLDGKDGAFYLGDYASLGRDWKSSIAAWLKTDESAQTHTTQSPSQR